MEERTKNLLKSVILEHIKTAEPVGSKLLVDKYKLDVSSATVRNELAILEEEGYIFQPYTSAGRVPTAKGYQFYLDNYLEEREPKEVDRKNLEQVVKKLKDNPREMVKILAKNIAENSGQLVFVGFAKNDVYYTGISNIFAQPEFVEQNLVYDLSLVVDHLDEVLVKIFNNLPVDTQIVVGAKNPFGNICASIISSYRAGKDAGIFGLVGPMRMDYAANLGLVNYARELINNI